MFHGKSMTIAKVQPIAKTQIITIDVNVNVTTKNKATKRTNVQDREPSKAKSIVEREKEE